MLPGQPNLSSSRSRGRVLVKGARWAFAFVVLAVAAGPAGAQPQGGGAAAGGGAAGPSADGQVGFSRRAQLSPQDEVVEGEQILARMEGASAGIRRQLETARSQRDVVKTLCLNDKLSQVDVAIRSATDRQGSLKAAASHNDVELSNHEFTILSVLRQRAEQLTAEANQCIGEEAGFTGETKITSSVDPTLPPDDTDNPTTDPTVISEPPKCTSCSR